jgi:cytochrome c peroxidase
MEIPPRGFLFLLAVSSALVFGSMSELRGQSEPALGDFSYEFQFDETSGLPMEFDIADPLNRSLTIEQTVDFNTWTPFASIKVTNTFKLALFTPDVISHPTAFYRFAYDAAAQVPNSEATVLDLPATPFNYANIVLPAHLLTPQVQNDDNTPVDNPITDEGATLGRVLFYDKRFSINNTISCASCHHQDKGFTDGVQFSVGFEGGLTGRNSMSLANARFYQRGRFFWDERAPTLEFQTSQPTQDAVEMGSSFPEVIIEIAAEPYYQTLFEAAFPEDAEPSQANMERAIAQFIRSMVSYESKWDVGVPINFANFTPQEELGRQLFFNSPPQAGHINCALCHETQNFVQPVPRNNGLDLVTTDAGFAGVTGRPQDEGRFKMASLRNVELTGPYMHDGRFDTLEEVVLFYSNGIQLHPNLNGRLRVNGFPPPGPSDPPPGPPLAPNYTPSEAAALVAFLKTLTDTNFTTDPRWSDPFK